MKPMNQSPSWEGNVLSDIQIITCTLWNTYIHYCFQKSPPPVPVLNSVNPFKAHSSYFRKIHFNILLQHMHTYYKWSLPFTFPYENPVRISVLTLGLSKGNVRHSKWFPNAWATLVSVDMSIISTANLYMVMDSQSVLFTRCCQRDRTNEAENDVTYSAHDCNSVCIQSSWQSVKWQNGRQRFRWR
jgi:hypothetical protein